MTAQPIVQSDVVQPRQYLVGAAVGSGHAHSGGLPDTLEPCSMRSRAITVLIADGSVLYAGAMRTMLANEGDVEVLAVAFPDSDLVAAVAAAEPDIALVDIDVPGRSGSVLCAAFAAVSPATRPIFMTSTVSSSRSVEPMVRASGYLAKQSGVAVLLDCIRRVSAGHRVVDPRLRPSATVGGPRLTPREIHLLRRSASGAPIRDLAEQLDLSQGTVRNYLSCIMGKLGAQNRMEAIRMGREAGWL